MYKNSPIKAFYEIDGSDFLSRLEVEIDKEINELDKNYILSVDENEYKDYLKDKYTLEELKVYFESEQIDEPKKTEEWREYSPFRDKYKAEVYNFTIRYTYSGTDILFKVRPKSSYTMTTTDLYVDVPNNTVAFKFKLYEKDPQKFIQEKESCKKRAFTNMEATNKIVDEWNSLLKSKIDRIFKNYKDKFLKENDFFAAINIKVNEDTKSIFTVPTITKKNLPQPTISSKKEFTSEPSMSQKMYNDVLKVIYDFGKGMERKPSLYQGKDEEQLRDNFVMLLETRYDATTAAGETFNRGGKTDIILKYADDGSNLFVAECKFWHGSSEFLKAISQLFDRYLTWRDSKTALILFSENKDFTNVLNTIKTDIKTHPYYVKENGVRGDSSFSYIFRLPQDKDKEVFFEVIVFHFDK